MSTMSAIGRRPTPAERERLAPSVEALVSGLFGGADPVLEGTGTQPEAIRAFAQSEAVLRATFDYLRALKRIWRSQYPGKRLKLRRADHAAKGTAAPRLDAAWSEAPPERDPACDDLAGSASGTGAASLADSATPQEPEPKASFRLPNAKVGVDYAAAIESWDGADRPVAVLDVEVPSELGLDFDAERGELRGTPRIDGDHRLRVHWAPQASEDAYIGECLLIVNPDPRSLWKIIEPPADAPYAKPHQDSEVIVGAGHSIAAASRRGRSHEHAGTFRDDDFFIQQDPVGGWSVLIVADGAGSASFSREGARLAALTAGEHLADALTGELGSKMSAALEDWGTDPQQAQQTIGAAFHYLFHQAGARAVQAIEQAADARQATPKAYATTLLAAVVKRQPSGTFLASFWLGDGAIAAYGPRGKVRLMGTPDGGEFAGQTRFLDRAALTDQGEKGFARRVQFGFFEDLAAIMLMTDGVSDPRFETDRGLKDPARWDALWDELRPILDGPEPGKALLEWLGFFSPGNHDDRTIAIFW